jgi:hypothetical protein
LVKKSVPSKFKVGYATDIGFTRTYISKLDWPYSSCRADVSTIQATDSEYYKYTLKKDNVYSESLCNEFCIQYKYVQSTCNCTDPSVPIYNERDKVCKSINELKCVTQARNISETSCDQLCPSECNTFKFSTTLSMAACKLLFY